MCWCRRTRRGRGPRSSDERHPSDSRRTSDGAGHSCHGSTRTFAVDRRDGSRRRVHRARRPCTRARSSRRRRRRRASRGSGHRNPPTPRRPVAGRACGTAAYRAHATVRPRAVRHHPRCRAAARPVRAPTEWCRCAGRTDERRLRCEARTDARHVVGGTGRQLLLDAQVDRRVLHRIAGHQRRADPVVEQKVQQAGPLRLFGKQLADRRAEPRADPAAQQLRQPRRRAWQRRCRR